MKNSSSVSRVVAMQVAEFQVVEANESRTVLIIGQPSTGTLSLNIGPDTGTAATGRGVNLFIGSAPFVLTKRMHGDMVCREIRGISSAGGNMGVWETIGGEEERRSNGQ